MVRIKDIKELFADIRRGTILGVKLSGRHVLKCYLQTPIGILAMLGVLYAANEIILQTGINFPASVTCMLLLYFFLLISARFLGTARTALVVKIIDIPAGFCLRWINIFFTPAFITLPLSSWISAREALTIAAVFIFGYLMGTAGIAYFSIMLQKVLKMGRRSNVERAEELTLMGTHEQGDSVEHDEGSEPVEEVDANTTALHKSSNLDNVPENIINDLPRGDSDSEEERYRDELTAHINDGRSISILEQTDSSNSANVDMVNIELTTNKDRRILRIPSMPSPVAKFQRPNNPGMKAKLNKFNKLLCKRSTLEQHSSKPRETIIAEFVLKNFDYIILFFLFIVGLAVYFTIEYAMFLHLSIAITTFLLMLKLPPPKFKKFLHPVLCSVCLSWLVFYIFSLMESENFLKTLTQYKTGRTYLQLFNLRKTNKYPGCGDVFSTLMDVSIVSLSLPMYTYRNDLKRHFLAIFPCVLLMSFSNFFIYPPLCYHLGISAERSLGFAGRSVTLALGTPFVEALDGSIPLMACTTVVSGIVGVLTSQFLFGKRVLRIRDDDYVTRGITMGVNCGAIATAHLLTIDPRAAAMSSLSFVLFGTIMVILASISPLAHVIKGWVGM